MNSNIPDEAVEAAESAVMTAMLERPGADGYVDGYRETPAPPSKPLPRT